MLLTYLLCSFMSRGSVLSSVKWGEQRTHPSWALVIIHSVLVLSGTIFSLLGGLMGQTIPMLSVRSMSFQEERPVQGHSVTSEPIFCVSRTPLSRWHLSLCLVPRWNKSIIEFHNDWNSAHERDPLKFGKDSFRISTKKFWRTFDTSLGNLQFKM